MLLLLPLFLSLLIEPLDCAPPICFLCAIRANFGISNQLYLPYEAEVFKSLCVGRGA